MKGEDVMSIYATLLQKVKDGGSYTINLGLVAQITLKRE